MNAPHTTLPALPDDLAAELEGRSDLTSTSTTLSIYRTRLAVYRTHVANLRSHLANERTHLAYLRTCVSLIGFGITINRFGIFLLQQGQALKSRPLLQDASNAGLGMVILGLLLLLWSIYRYWQVSRDIESGQFVSRYRGTLGASIGLLVLGGVTALWLFLF